MGIRGRGDLIPAGTEAAYHGGAVPPGWLLMYGQVVAIADYPRLFGVLGTRYGGDGVATFGIPDSRGRVTAGKDNMGGSAANRLTSGASGVDGATLGSVGGGETVTLTTTQMPSHDHTVDTVIGDGGQSGVIRNSNGSTPGNSGFINLTGGGGAHRTVQPTLIANKMIKT